VAALAAALGSPYAVSAAAYLPAEAAARLPMLAWLGGSVTLARIEDFAPSVAYRTDRLRSDLAAFGVGELLDDGATRAVWQAIGAAVPLGAEPDQAIWRISVRPSSGPAVAKAIDAAFGASDSGQGARWFMDWGGGLVWVSAPATEAAHAEIRRVAQDSGGSWILFRGPETLRAALDVIPAEPAPLARISQRVKAAFDPKGILNPGRMRAGF
jgi:glycolate oxidase FAD binding subunit